MIEADRVRERSLERFRAAFLAGRYRAAEDYAADLCHYRLHPQADDIERLAMIAKRVATGERPWDPEGRVKGLAAIEQEGDGWLGVLNARLSRIRRQELASDIEGALIDWVAAAEVLPLAWAIAVTGVDPDVLAKLPAPAASCYPAIRPEEKGVAAVAANAAICAHLQHGCDACPLRQRGTLARQPVDSGPPCVAAIPRYTGARVAVSARNRWAHPKETEPHPSADVVRHERKALEKIGVVVRDDSLWGVLAAGCRAALGCEPSDPLALVEREVVDLVGPGDTT